MYVFLVLVMKVSEVLCVRCILAYAVRSNFSVVSVRGGNFIRVSNHEMYDFRNILK